MALEQTPQHAISAAGQPSWIAPIKPVVPDHELFVRIGGGSYGDVWLARSVVGTWRAVKVVFRDRFLDAKPYEREFSGIQKFEPLSRSNEGFIDILQIGRNDAEGYFYYVMELADDASGAAEIRPETYVPKTLSKSLLQRGRLPVSDCLELGMTLNLALTRLHEAGLIHRDIKPSNIIFVGGVPKLADIGLVIEVAEARSYVGTEGFIPPEGPNSAQADLYSLGKVLYEAGMGKDRKDFPEPLTQIAQAPDSTELLEFNAILLKACAANVKERYQSAGEMNADLALVQSGGSVRRQRALMRRLRSVQRAGALVTALALVISAGWLWQARQTSIVRQLANEKTQLAQQKTELAADKTRLAEENRERVVRLDVANAVPLMDEDPAGAMLWFADVLPRMSGRTADEEMQRIRINQMLIASPKLLSIVAETNSIIAGDISPNGDRIAEALVEGTVKLREPLSTKLVWQRTFPGKAVRQVRFFDGGKRLLVCSSNQRSMAYLEQVHIGSGLAVVLETDTGQTVFSATGPEVTACCLSPDERWLAIGLTNHLVRVLDPKTGSIIAELRGHEDYPSALSFTADGSLLASGSPDKSARFWRIPSGEQAQSPVMQEVPITALTLSENGRYLATSGTPSTGGDPVIYVWELGTHKRIGNGISESGHVRALFFLNGNNPWLVTGGDDDKLHIWVVNGDINGDKHDLTMYGTVKVSRVRCWDFGLGRSLLAVGTDFGQVSVMDANAGIAKWNFLCHNSWVGSTSFSTNGQLILTTSDDATAKLWAVTEAAKPQEVSLPSKLEQTATGPNEFKETGTANLLMLPLADHDVHVFDTARLAEVQLFRAPEPAAKLTARLSSPSGRFCLLEWHSGDPPKQIVELRHAEKDQWQKATVAPQSEVLDWAFSEDESKLITLCSDSRLRYWRTKDAALDQTMELPGSCWRFPSPIIPRALSPRGSTLILGQSDPGLGAQFRIFDLQNAALRPGGFAVRNLPENIVGLRLSPDGLRVAGIADQSAYGVDLSAAKPSTKVFKHGGELREIHWSPDGRRLLTAGYRVKIWDSASGEVLAIPSSEENVSACWSADGRFITTWKDDTVRVYDSATAEPVTTGLFARGNTHWASIPQTNRLIAASEPNLLCAWSLEPTDLPAQIIADYAKLMSGRKLSTGGLPLPLQPHELAELWSSLRVKAPALFAVPTVRIGVHSPPPDKLPAIPQRDASTSDNLVDLSRFYTHSFEALPNGEFVELPRGVHWLGGTPFDLRGVLRLEGANFAAINGASEQVTFASSVVAEVRNIPVGKRCGQLCFLHAVDGYRASDGDEVARWVIHYSDGSTREWPVIYGQDVNDWWFKAHAAQPTTKASIAWEGHRPEPFQMQSIRLFKSVWNNPAPEIEVTSLDFVLGKMPVRPFVVAITAE